MSDSPCVNGEETTRKPKSAPLRFLHRSILAGPFLVWIGCVGLEVDDSTAGTPLHSERGGIGLQASSKVGSQAELATFVSPSQVIDARRSLAVTETAILSQFTLPA